MAVNVETNKVTMLTKHQCKNIAAKTILGWATLNQEDKEEDFYTDFYNYEYEEISDSKDIGLVHLTEQEKEWMRKEFETLANIISSRIRKRKED